MSTTRCDRCGHNLRIAGEEVGMWLTCPRCLSSILNPRRGAAPVADQPKPADKPPPYCWDCGADVEASWRYCPRCNADQHAPRWSRAAPVEQERARDSRGAFLGLVVLTVLTAAGIILFLVLGGMELVHASEQGPAVLGMALIVILVIGGGAGVMIMTSRNTVATTISGTMAGFLIGAVLALTMMALLCFAIISSIQKACHCSKPPPKAPAKGR